ncbi:hypothetical protein, partial [Streptomyces shenzhenensis]|uniref:hypothetical protein n=1 Tax=Streptomyces shenzhenensis TaxID=943815 RepID=UPI0036B6CFF4
MTAQATARRGLCSSCERFADGIQLIQVDDAGSGTASAPAETADGLLRVSARELPRTLGPG